MSRIHEALKKAAQERNAQQTDFTGVGPHNPSSEGMRAALLLDNQKQFTGATSATDGDGAFLRYQSFVKDCPRPSWRLPVDASVFSSESLFPLGAERFRTLRSRLYQIADTRPLRKVLVTSTVAAEGKTFVASNLAQSFVRQTNRSIILVDADLRAPRLHWSLGAPASPGLTEYLRGQANLSQVIQVGLEGNLCLIPAGSHISNPTELLHSERMKQLLDVLSGVFDWVLLDSPPSLAVHDASILADMCDGVLFVVRAGATDSSLADKAIAEFREKNLLGVVLNRVEKSDSYGQYYYGYPSENAQASPATNK